MKWRVRWYFIKPWKNFFPTYSVLEKSAYHLIVAISEELPTYMYTRRVLKARLLIFFSRAARCGTFMPNWHISRSVAHLVAHYSVNQINCICAHTILNVLQKKWTCRKDLMLIPKNVEYDCFSWFIFGDTLYNHYSGLLQSYQKWSSP